MYTATDNGPTYRTGVTCAQWNTIQPLKRTILPLAATWMNLEGITLSEISQTKKSKYPWHAESEKVRLTETQSRKLGHRGLGGEGGEGEMFVSIWKRRKSRIWENAVCHPYVRDSLSDKFALLELGENSGTGLLSSTFLLEAAHQFLELGA